MRVPSWKIPRGKISQFSADAARLPQRARERRPRGGRSESRHDSKESPANSAKPLCASTGTCVCVKMRVSRVSRGP